MESKVQFNPDLESEGGKLYRQYCEEKGIEYSITAGANFCLGYMAVKPNYGARWVKASEYDHSKGGVLFYRFLGPTLKSCGTGNFSGGVFHGLIGDHFSKEQWEYLYILDESAGESDAVDWIDVNDRLPYRDGDSSVYCLVNDTYDGIVVRPFNEAHQCWDQEDGDDYYADAKGGKITHWKPLPEPPKRKQQKEK